MVGRKKKGHRIRKGMEGKRGAKRGAVIKGGQGEEAVRERVYMGRKGGEWGQGEGGCGHGEEAE
jgi:hypothetical protein